MHSLSDTEYKELLRMREEREALREQAHQAVQSDCEHGGQSA